MKILLLGEKSERLKTFLIDRGEQVTRSDLHPVEVDWYAPEWVISYGYRYVIRSECLAVLSRPAINLHISLLPWNRGADPNLWSWIEGTPKGVTIHEIDKGLDTGPILLQKRLFFVPHKNMTLARSYDILCEEIEELFFKNYDALRTRTIKGKKPGSYHRSSDKGDLMQRLQLGWQTPVSELKKLLLK